MDEGQITLFKKKGKRSNAAETKQGKRAKRADDAEEEERAELPERALGVASTSSAAAKWEEGDNEEETTTFKDLGLTDWLCGVLHSLGIDRPTPVQRGCIPAVLAGRDVIGTAQTGSGKTAAFALPILHRLAKDPYGVFALVLTPTRELAVQLAEQFRAFGAGMSLRDCVVIGGVEQQSQAKQLARRPHVVVATPGRLAELIETDAGLRKGFANTRFLVLDEADRLLDPSFEGPLRSILAALPPDGRQTLLFSATMTQALVKLQSERLEGAHVFKAYEGLKTADRLRQEYVFVPAKVKEVYLYHLLQSVAPARKVRSAIVFAGTCRSCQLLALLLRELDLPCAELHSGKSQRDRLSALAAFKSEAVPLLVATDVASRGLDIPAVDLVVHFDLPVAARDYVHRSGRTARAGRPGWSLAFVTQYDVELVHAIESLMGHQLSPHEMPENEVLKGITRVYAARKRAALEAVRVERQRESAGRGGAGAKKSGSKGGGGGKRKGGGEGEAKG